LHKETGKWEARIWTGSRDRHLGYFRSLEEAAAAYDKAALEQWGEFARLNGPVQLNTLLSDDSRAQMCRWLRVANRQKKRVGGDPRAKNLAITVIDAVERLLALDRANAEGVWNPERDRRLHGAVPHQTSP
jgi:hypothetical protein